MARAGASQLRLPPGAGQAISAATRIGCGQQLSHVVVALHPATCATFTMMADSIVFKSKKPMSRMDASCCADSQLNYNHGVGFSPPAAAFDSTEQACYNSLVLTTVSFCRSVVVRRDLPVSPKSRVFGQLAISGGYPHLSQALAQNLPISLPDRVLSVVRFDGHTSVSLSRNDSTPDRMKAQR